MTPHQPDALSTPPQRVAILINPAAGKDVPILAPINRVLGKCRIEWEPHILKPQREPDAVAAAVKTEPDALWVYGGDGTVARIATAMLQQGVTRYPLAVLGGGTANALAQTLDAPGDLEQVLELLCKGAWATKRIDVGTAGDRAFLLRATVGAMAGMTSRTTREEKDRLGLMAYALSSLRALTAATPQRFQLTVDEETVEHEAISVLVAKSAGTGIGAALASGVEEHDRRLHALVVPSIGWATRALANVARGGGLLDGCARYVGQRVGVAADIPADVHLDGESIGQTPVTLTVRPSALSLVHYRVD